MIIGVHPLAGFDKLLHYRVPEPLRAHMAVGSLVRVPILNHMRLGIVGEIGAPPANFPLNKLKNIAQLLHPFPALTPDLLELARWMSAYYACGLDTIIEAMLPAPVRNGATIKTQKQLTLARRLTVEELETLNRRAPQQAKLYAFIAQQFKPQPKSLVLTRLDIGAPSAAALVKNGVLRETETRVERIAYADALAAGEITGDGELVAAHPPALNLDQRHAADALAASLRENKFGVTLLHGITGSGKTEVYLHAIHDALASGGGVIFLVPEIALTPQTIARLRARLAAIAPADTAVVWHYHLSDGERHDAWHALATGEKRIVVGARSAIFAPVRNLRLIVVDEEHEPAYKQDETPRYHGRDTAVMRAKLAAAHILLGSATPSLESFHNAQTGRYRLLQLPHRIDNRQLPTIQIVDMRIEVTRARGLTTLSHPLVEAMQARYERKEQTILFINRRGYSSSMLCTECGHIEECEHCSIAMTYHRHDERLRCHLCGSERPAPLTCPQCHSPKIRMRGLGTQRVEEAVRRILPRARVERMDTDTMSKKNRFREVLTRFRSGQIDILVGTQMIGKGLDFPNVTLVGLVDADISMHVPDFRANERTFQLLVQVAGRAGRGDRAGEVIVQTFTPQSEAIQFSRHADYAGFTASELTMRQSFQYPPYRHLIHHSFRGPNPEKLQFYAEQWAKKVEQTLSAQAVPAAKANAANATNTTNAATATNTANAANANTAPPLAVELRGPSPAPIEKIKDEYRYQLWYFTTQVTKTVALLTKLRADFAWPDDVTQVLDVDPASLV